LHESASDQAPDFGGVIIQAIGSAVPIGNQAGKKRETVFNRLLTRRHFQEWRSASAT